MTTGTQLFTSPSLCLTHNKADCPFCNAQEKPEALKNNLKVKDPAELLEASEMGATPAIQWQAFHNDSTKLTQALKSFGVELGDARDIQINGHTFTSQTAAHHLIPGNGSLGRSDLFSEQKYLWKDGKVKGNIGYDVNSAANGVFLPGCYAYLGKWGDDGTKFNAAHKDKGVNSTQFAHCSMEGPDRHFHNAHGQYNKFLIKVLNDINEKLTRTELACEEGQKGKDKGPEEREPLLKLINVLNKLSGKMRNMVSGSKTDWRSNIFTSTFADKYMQKHGISAPADGDAIAKDVLS